MIREPSRANGGSDETWHDTETAGATPAALRGSSAADRFCAWKGRSERRSIFSVFPIDLDTTLDDLPLEAGAVVLGVRRMAGGARRVMWACAVEAGRLPAGLAPAITALAADGVAEVHLHLLATAGAAREAIAVDLGFPRLVMARGEATPQMVARAPGASMNPPDWRCQRSA